MMPHVKVGMVPLLRKLPAKTQRSEILAAMLRCWSYNLVGISHWGLAWWSVGFTLNSLESCVVLMTFIWCKIDIQTPNRKRGGHVVDAPIVSALPFFSLFGEMGLTMVDNFDFLERYFGIVCTTWGSKMIFHTWSTQQQCHHRFWHQVQANLAFTEYFPHRCFAYIGISWSIASNIIPPNQTCSRLGSVSFSQGYAST